MDIHRCRFVPYPPSAINAAAFSHGPDPSKKTPEDLRLALGRANGDIEIWNPYNGNWFQETILRGGRDRSVEGLLWTEDRAADHGEGDGKLRLFSIGFSSSITEWDLERGTTSHHANGNYGEIWCFAAQPRSRRKTNGKDNLSQTYDQAASSQYIAAGCADGNILLFSTEDGDLKFSKVVGAPPTKKPRVLSIAWKNEDVIIAGYSDGTIRLYDIKARKFLRSMSLGRPGDGSNETLVWSVQCLPDETIISGDSTGEIKIWDSKNFSLIQRLQGHQADVLDIAISADGEMIISGGADRRTIAFKPVGSKKAGRPRRWAEIMHRRFHRHDVKALATFESRDLSVLISGGLDTVPIVIPLREWQSEYHRSLPNIPRALQTCSAPAARLLVSWWDHEINIWHIPEANAADGSVNTPPSVHGRYQMVRKIVLTGDEHIAAASISSDGTLLAVSTSVETKVFRLRKQMVLSRVVVKVYPVETPRRLRQIGARSVKFSPDSCWLALVNTNGNVFISELTHTLKGPTFNGEAMRLRRRSRLTASSSMRVNTKLGNYRRTVLSMSFSSDSGILAIGDIAGSIDCWVLAAKEKLIDATPLQEDDPVSDGISESSSDDSSDDEPTTSSSQGRQWVRAPTTLPSLGSPVLVLSFRPPGNTTKVSGTNDGSSHATQVNDDRLIAVTASHHIAEFKVLQGCLSDWSRRNPATFLPSTFSMIKDRVMDCVWDVGIDFARVYLYGPSWIFMFDLSKDLPEPRVVGRLGTHEVVQPALGVLGKRKISASGSSKTHNSGAGDAMQVKKSYVGSGAAFKRFKGGIQADNYFRSIGLDRPRGGSPSEGESDESHPSNLAISRRGRREDGEDGITHGDTQALDGDGDGDSGEERSRATDASEDHNWWYTYNYRPIVGIVPLESGADERTTQRGNLEVALVERPIWDIELPPRYDEPQDWET